MTIEHVVREGLCTQCGTCAGVCPQDALRMRWTLRDGWLPEIDHARCTDCGACDEVCPGEGFDYGCGAWWRERNGDAPFRDFLGPYRGLWYGWASDPDTRFAGASGGIATALLQGALEQGDVDAVIGVRMSRATPLAAEPAIARSTAGVAALRGSKYSMVAVGEALREVRASPGRYAFVGLPCHIQGLRLAQRRSRVLRERIPLTVGVFCGFNMLPRATCAAARRIGVDPAELTMVGYRGPDWPGELRLHTRSGALHTASFADYYDRYIAAWIQPRCRTCADALVEPADIALGDTWLERFYGSPGVSDLIARTSVGYDLIERLTPAHLTLMEASPEEMVASQSATYRVKRPVLRGRTWLRRLGGRAVPEFPGLQLAPSTSDKLAGIRDLLTEAAYRRLGDLRYR
jgi:coenzyme F420 hydrogenase subunit beta